MPDREGEIPARPAPIPPAVNEAVQTARARIAGSPTGAISVDKLLHQYGKTHMQLVFSEEQLGAARQMVMSLEVQLKTTLKKVVLQDEYIKKLETLANDAIEGNSIDTHDVTELRKKLKPGLTPIRDIEFPEVRPADEGEAGEAAPERPESGANSQTS